MFTLCVPEKYYSGALPNIGTISSLISEMSQVELSLMRGGHLNYFEKNVLEALYRVSKAFRLQE